MPFNKSQHFVPQHYLRQFRASNTKQVFVARLKPFSVFGLGSIRDQCKSDYFYRHDGELDALLTQSEQDLAPVLINVTESERFDTKELLALRLLAVILHVRTRKAVEHSKLFPRKVAYEALKVAIDKKELPEPEGGLRPSHMDFIGAAGGLMKASAIPCWMEMATLECRLLKASGIINFITSDHPVVLLNQFLSKEAPGRSFAGFSRSGFQLLLPISPQLCLFFYDPKVYKVGARRARVIPISDHDADIVNSLQLQNADECIYFHSDKCIPSVTRLHQEYGRLRRPLQDHLTEHSIEGSSNRLLHLRGGLVQLPKTWEFCSKRRHPSIGANYRRDQSWTSLIDILVKDFDRDPNGGDLFDRIGKILGEKIKHTEQHG